MATYRTLAIVNDVHTCDCCGKSNLKCTVAMESDDGDVVHFGTVCATRHSGRDLPTIKREIQTAKESARAAARKEYVQSSEHLAAQLIMMAARRLNLTGKQFRDHCRAEQDAATAKRAEIAARHGLHAFEVHD